MHLYRIVTDMGYEITAYDTDAVNINTNEGHLDNK